MTGPCHSMRLKIISTLLARDVLNAREFLLNTFDMSTSHNWHWQRKKQVTQLQLLLFKICKRWKAFAACFGTSCTWNRSWKGAPLPKLLSRTCNDSVQEFTQWLDVEWEILKNNEVKYHQTESAGCQFLDAEFIQAFGNYGESPAANEVLDGTFQPPQSTSAATRDFLRASCLSVDGSDTLSVLPPIRAQYHDLKHHSWKIQKEKTSIYHQHIGHYKAVMQDSFLSCFFFQRAEIPSLSRYSPLRHRQCVDLMILKCAGYHELTNLFLQWEMGPP